MRETYRIFTINGTGLLEVANATQYITQAQAVRDIRSLADGAYIVFPVPVYVKEAFMVVTPPVGCTAEKTGLAITDTTAANFVIGWTNPVDYVGTQVRYRVVGSGTWLVPNAAGNATGSFNGPGDEFTFDSGFTVGIDYEIEVKNSCSSVAGLSPGLAMNAVAT